MGRSQEEAWAQPLSLCFFVSSFLLIVRELKLIFARFLIVYVACITTLQMLDLLDEDVETLAGNMEDGFADLHFFRVHREGVCESDLI